MITKKSVGLVVLAVLSIALVGFGQQGTPQTVHVRSSRVETRDEISPGLQRTFLGVEWAYMLYAVDAGKLTYELESADLPRLEVGKDYEVEGRDNNWLLLRVAGRRKNKPERLFIKSTSEKESGK